MNDIEPWLRVVTSRVIAKFTQALAMSHGWQTIHIVSPWISAFGGPHMMGFEQFLARLKADNATIYVVTRPPLAKDEWHGSAIKAIVETGRANVALVPSLHAKLYCARTKQGAVGLLASANFTQQSLENQEIGVMLSSYGKGGKMIERLMREAGAMYRTDGRRVISHAQF